MWVLLIVATVEVIVIALGKLNDYKKELAKEAENPGYLKAKKERTILYRKSTVLEMKNKLQNIILGFSTIKVIVLGVVAVLLIVWAVLFFNSPMEQFKRAMKDKDAYKANYIYQSMSESEQERAMEWATKEIPYIVEELKKTY